jgi:hypothetical protein
MRSVMERSVRLVNSYLHKDAVSLRGSRKFQVWDFLSVSYEWFSLCKELQYKSLHRDLTIPWRRWYRHLLKTYGHGFLQKVEVKVLMY